MAGFVRASQRLGRAPASLVLVALTGCVTSSSAGTIYFPPGSLEPECPEIDALFRDWYSRCLGSMSEPSLACADSDSLPSCRFLYLPTFDPAICVRLERALNGVRITVTKVSFRDGWPPDPRLPAARKEFTTRDVQWEVLQEQLASAAIWSPPGSTEEELFTADGSQWLLELRHGENYRVVHRHSPRADGPHAELRRLCLDLLAVARVELPPEGIY